MVILKMECRKSEDINDFTRETGERRGGMLYFHEPHNNDKLVARVVTKLTDPEWLKQEISSGRIYIPTEQITAEKS